MSKSRVFKMIIMGLALFLTGVVFALGVTAISNSKLTSFRTGIKYDPEVFVSVEMEIDGEYKQVFSSSDPEQVNYHAYYIDSITSDTINFKNDTLFVNNGAVNIRIYNHDTTNPINCYINNGADAIFVNKANGNQPASTETTFTVGEPKLGIVLLSLTFEIAKPFTITYTFDGCTAITQPIETFADKTQEIVVKATNMDNTIFNASATNGTLTQTAVDWESTYMIVTYELSNVTENTTLTFTAVVDYWDGSIATTFAGGDGSENSPYLIGNGSQLALLAKIINTADDSTYSNYPATTCRTAEYKMVKNIYLNQTADSTTNNWTPIGGITTKSDGTYYAFSGHFNGNGFIVNNLYINSTTQFKLALFVGSKCTIQNLGVENIKITCSNTISEKYMHMAGILIALIKEDTIASFNNDASIIKNCFVKNGTMTGTSSSVAQGAGFSISGIASASLIQNCFVDNVVINSYKNIKWGGSRSAGIGLECNVANSFAHVNINTTTSGGSYYSDHGAYGINSFLVAMTDAFTPTGGYSKNCVLLGDAVRATNSSYRNRYSIALVNTVTGLYYNSATSFAGSQVGHMGTAKTLAEMQTESFWTTASNWDASSPWDFENTWRWDENLKHPVLKVFDKS